MPELWHGRADWPGQTGDLFRHKVDLGTWDLWPTKLPSPLDIGYDCPSIDGSSNSDFWVAVAGQYNYSNYVARWAGGPSWQVSDPIRNGTVHQDIRCISTWGPGVFIGSCRRNGGGPFGDLLRWDGTTLTHLWATAVFPCTGHSGCIVKAISANECYFGDGHNYGSTQSSLFHWTLAGGAVQESIGSGLPAGAILGIEVFDSQLFVLLQNGTEAGHVYRGQFGGPWTKDTTADGPFTVPGYEGCPRRMRMEATGATLCVNGDTNFHIRQGDNSWSTITAKGFQSLAGEPAMAGDLIVASDYAGTPRYSEDGGTSWNSSPDAPSLGRAGGWAYVGAFITDVSPSLISTAGGHLMTATGQFTAGAPLAVHLGPLGNVDDPLCYGGQGYGYSPISADGTTVSFVSPPLPKGDAGVTIIDGSDTLTFPVGSVTVVERSWPVKFHQLRKSNAPWWAVGPRRLELEELE
jgi:hypothetical protein